MSRRKTLIAANWKMNKTIAQAVSFVEAMEAALPSYSDREVVIAPPFTALQALRSVVRRHGVYLAAQNCHWEEHGAFTGEISPLMLADAGCTYVIVGHSERRQLFGETDEIIGKKLTAVLRHGLIPILCVGESLEEREGGRTFGVVERQLKSAFKVVQPEDAPKIVVAYEPVWAIGTGRTAEPSQAQEVHAFIRSLLETMCNKAVATSLRILYGGSVKPDNVDSLMREPDIDGLLVGGASLEVSSFCRIVGYRER